MPEPKKSDDQQAAEDERKYGQLRPWCGRLGFVHFEGHTFVFRQPNQEHGRFFRRNNGTNPDCTDQLAQQLIVAMNDAIAPDLAGCAAVRAAFNTWLATRPLALDNAYFGPVLNELLGLVEEGYAASAGKGCNVSNSSPKTSETD